MANNKIQLRDGTILLDLSADTVTSGALSAGTTAHDASGAQITGTGGIFSFDANGKFRYPETVVVPNTVTRIPSNSADGFYKHSEIKHIIYEDGETPLQTTGWYSFEGCTGLIDCVLPSRFSGTQFPDFKDCTLLVSVNVPASVTEFSNTFQNCTSLTSFSFPDSVTSLSGTFRACSNLVSVTLSKNTTEISSDTFAGCTALAAIELPAALRTIGSGAFYRCEAITNLNFKNVTSIGSSVVRECTALKNVVFETVPTTNTSNFASASTSNPFYGCTAIENITIPTGWNFNTFFSNGNSNFTNVLTHDSMVAMIANLYDYSGGTAHTLTLGATNLARLSEAEKSVAAAKNWTLA